ncbi:MAG TPA: 2-C-methyl-D-erythritol 2,4-cyclodiphosphate synthase [Mycobacteriales bacterium]|nr:2-C-methyl-D-erythritol 2,4-cyclodiphosphate synthase [Mycobacteriales bacterium]
MSASGDVVPIADPQAQQPRVGIGVDVHAYGADTARTMWLGGLAWPGEAGLVGHSDGDVAAHAACDALLSAAGLGDLGSVFGTDDPSWANATGVALLTATVHLVQGAGYSIGNIAVQVIGNRPRLAARRVEAEAALTAAAGAPVSVAATTSDGLGLTGRGEGVAAVATALVFRR